MIRSANPLLLDLSPAAVFGDAVLGDTPGQGAGLVRLAATYDQTARLLRCGDEREDAVRLPVSLLTLPELLAWAALIAAANQLDAVPGETGRWRELNDRRIALEKALTRRTRTRVKQQTEELLNRLPGDEGSRMDLEEALHEICSRLEHGTTVPDGAVVEILRAVVAAVGAAKAAPSDQPPEGGPDGAMLAS